MTGVESAAVLAGGGRILGSLAIPAGRALADRITFRWKVARLVRRDVDFPCPWGTYRKWLKTIEGSELSRPVEDVQGPLALRLDEALVAASEDWESSEGHLSRSLYLVELTYPAIASALNDRERALLSETWAQTRSVAVRNALLQYAGPDAALSRDDLALVMMQKSDARRRVRLQAFDVEQGVLAAHINQIEVLVVPAGEVVVLLGDFGSGKSESAESWHRAAIQNFRADDCSALPVWLGARDLRGLGLEGALDNQFGHSWRQKNGASITVDGLDEIDPSSADGLLESARILVRTYSDVRILLTARPGILSPTQKEEIRVKLLQEQDALKLVESLGGKSLGIRGWTEDMKSTVTRPFFALAAGSMLRRDEAPSGEADLIRSLVEGALSTGTERSALTTDRTRKVLENLAVNLTKGGRDALSFSDCQIARSSRLVADHADGSITFSLPIFQHWFAAQVLVAGEVEAKEVVSDASSFIRWRWAAAVAVLSARGSAALDDLLAIWVAGNPGAGAWIIKEAFGGHRGWRSGSDAVLEATSSGDRLLLALRTWTDALGPLADGLLPYPLVNGPVGLGVRVSGNYIDVAFARVSPSVDYVAQLPIGVHPLLPDSSVVWLPWTSGIAPRSEAWPWIMVLNRIANETLTKLCDDPYLGTENGIWVQERRYHIARQLVGRGSLFDGPIPASEVRERAERSFVRVNRDRRATFGGIVRYSGADLDDLISWIDRAAPGEVVSHLPEQDIVDQSGQWVWDFYSPRRLMEFEAEVYGRACEAYDEALSTVFSNLGWAMPSSAFAPFGVLLELRFDDHPSDERPPGISEMRVPMELLRELASSSDGAIWSASGRAVAIEAPRESSEDLQYFWTTLEKARSWLAGQDREPLGGLGWSYKAANNMADVRPASGVAANWLWKDLKILGLGEGTFPQLR